MEEYEKLGWFYLGRPVDAATMATASSPLLYDSRDLLTHALIVGMTGSGKTGLGIGLLEEAALDGVPALVVDPKGDLANLLLTFPELRAEDFRPWVRDEDAARKGVNRDELAAATAESWRAGLARWDQDGARIRRLREAAEVALYTPGSGLARPISILSSFAAPPTAATTEPAARGTVGEAGGAGRSRPLPASASTSGGVGARRGECPLTQRVGASRPRLSLPRPAGRRRRCVRPGRRAPWCAARRSRRAPKSRRVRRGRRGRAG